MRENHFTRAMEEERLEKEQEEKDTNNCKNLITSYPKLVSRLLIRNNAYITLIPQFHFILLTQNKVKKGHINNNQQTT